jgi:hypothetical protein
MALTKTSKKWLAAIFLMILLTVLIDFVVGYLLR